MSAQVSEPRGVVSIDGVVQPLTEGRVSVLDRGFLYGDAVFEALRTHGGEPDELDAHLARLERSCAILDMSLPVSRQQLAGEVRAAIAAVPSAERYVRIMITRGEFPEALAPQAGGAGRRVVLVKPLAVPSAALYANGVRVLTCTAPPSPLTAGAKPAAYLSNMLAIARAQRAGCDDALLLGAHGELLEGATSSLFVVMRGTLFTPPLSLGILPGITRDKVWQSAEQAGLTVRERLLTVHDAYRADELFLTSSVREVVAVVAVDGLPIGTGAPGPITARVIEAYRNRLQLDQTPRSS